MRKLFAFFAGLYSCVSFAQSNPLCISGVYPETAYYNYEAECGTGAVVPWQGSLWVLTYAPHSPYGSSDKLYRIDPDLNVTVRDESIGGTPAGRMIHTESGQLVIGPYFIDSLCNVRSMSYETAPGRYTAVARHLSDPENRVYIGTMEEGFYDVDVHTLEFKTMWSDDNVSRRPANFPVLEENLVGLPGWHGKGMYSGQGVLVYANNGELGQRALEHFDAESGALCEWDGFEWTLVRRNQFTELTGPGGLEGNPNPDDDPIWTIGFDYKSLLLGVRSAGKGWTFFRLPKASYSYDGAHGWNTEWPRIRNVGTSDNPDYLMTMHGMFWHFPSGFSEVASKGIRPRGAYLKVIGDFARWNDALVCGCDDSAQKEFLNTRKAKGGIEGPGQSNSNLWFLPLDGPDHLGPTDASGYVWLGEDIDAGTVSEPFLVSGWKYRQCWIRNHSDNAVTITFEKDCNGTGLWRRWKKMVLLPGESRELRLRRSFKAEWLRAGSAEQAVLTLGFVLSNGDSRPSRMDRMFSGLSSMDDKASSQALLYGLGKNRRCLGMLGTDGRYYEADASLGILEKNDTSTAAFIRDHMSIGYEDIWADSSSVLVVDNSSRRWRLPLGDPRYIDRINGMQARICREVSTERDLLNCAGTFYELPAENADGFAKIRPVASHSLDIYDYASYRGLFIMSGVRPGVSPDGEHLFGTEDGGMTIWAGAIDDLWKLGKPVGHGGPWCGETVSDGAVSDPYLFGFYDKRTLVISHDNASGASFDIEIDPTGDGCWMLWKTVEIEGGKQWKHQFDRNVMGRWIRFRSHTDCSVTTYLEYK